MSMLFIPPLGTHLTLLEDWTFEVTNEHRNASLVEWGWKTGVIPPRTPTPVVAPWYESRYPLGAEVREPYHWQVLPATITVPMTLHAGTRLIVERIYIRRGAKGYDSVTFRIPKSVQRPSLRFFAKLADVNTMQVEVAQ